MRIAFLSFFSVFLFILLAAFSLPNNTSGHIFKVDIEVSEDLSRREIDHFDRNNKPIYKGESDHETFNKEQVEKILSNLDNIISLTTDNASMSHEQAKESIANKFGNIGSNVIGKSKMPFFPKTKLKKVKTKADTYYEIEVDFKYGGGKGRIIVMDKIKKVASIKFNVKVRVTAYNSKKKELWEKEQIITDFREAFNDPSSPSEVSEKWFEVSRAPILGNGQKEALGDKAAIHVTSDEFWQLSLVEIQSCIEIALTKTLE